MYNTINLMYGCETTQDFMGAACGRDADRQWTLSLLSAMWCHADYMASHLRRLYSS